MRVPTVYARQATATSGLTADITKTLDFRMVGPTRGGRVTAVAGHAATPGTFYSYNFV